MSARDAEAEQEVDLGRYWSAVIARWWLPLAGLVAGAAIGYLISVGGTESYKASATIYLAGAVIGALLFGYGTDRLGRKKLFFITVAVYLAATAATATSLL